jgi:exodeoxyribonuclease VII small subunit
MTEKSFEAAMERLEAIVQSLEEGLPLGKSLKVFEEGMQLSDYCSRELETAEKKVTLLIHESDGKYKETPFNPGGVKDDESSEL